MALQGAFPQQRGTKRPLPAQMPREVFFSNVPYSTTEETLREVFERAGTVEAVRIFKKPTGESRGMGVITFVDPESVQWAVQNLRDEEVNDRLQERLSVGMLVPLLEDIEVDASGDDKIDAATTRDASTAVPTPEAGISEDLDELRPWVEPPVPDDPNRIPARKTDSMEEFIPGPPVAEPLGHHTSALERLLVKRSDKDSSGSESSRKPPPPKVPRLDSPGFGQETRPKERKPFEVEFFDLDPVGKGTTTEQEDELRGAQALPVPHVPPRSRRERASPYDHDTPPWVGALEGRLLAHLEPLKADVSDISCRQTDLHREIAQFATEFRKHGERLDNHDTALQTHNRLHEGSISRIEALEKEVKELRAASRSPTPSRAPPSPGARSLTPQRERNIEEELQMAIGGWEDCRRDEAVEEAKAIFEAAQIPNAWLEIWSPYSSWFIKAEHFSKATGGQSRETAQKIATARALAKKAWMTSLLDRGVLHYASRRWLKSQVALIPKIKRPTKPKVKRLLDTLQTSLLASMLRPAYDGLQDKVSGLMRYDGFSYSGKESSWDYALSRFVSVHDAWACFALGLLLSVWKMSRALLKVQSQLDQLVESIRISNTPVIISEPAVFSDRVQQQVHTATQHLRNQNVMLQSMMLRAQDQIEKTIRGLGARVTALTGAVDTIEQMYEATAGCINDVFQAMDDVMRKENSLFQEHTAVVARAIKDLETTFRNTLATHKQMFEGSGFSHVTYFNDILRLDNDMHDNLHEHVLPALRFIADTLQALSQNEQSRDSSIAVLQNTLALHLHSVDKLVMPAPPRVSPPEGPPEDTQDPADTSTRDVVLSDGTTIQVQADD
ncbi:29 kDa ribonucleoprotein A, chloroplastic [Symbiodinium microadriaticum]|uniref:29 kDa ribonucleoprotein A, chloroplastic n=1 Tax=Symbiodinium microadriaticum TaxID=2951 RepID=A0A1Q9D420_SYMMI|nr:29 kDa ribonucleoprotein A, chloroplastic [Symbiodinium microadriaticum]